MKSRIIVTLLIFSTLAHSQSKFTFNENGLTPEYTVSQIDSVSATELYTKTLNWIKNTDKNLVKAIDSNVENKFIQFSGIKENAIHTDKPYFHLKYAIKISFKKGQYTFEPISIQTKANSKYDMGWQDFNLKNGASFFKKGKVIKKTKSYVNEIPAVLNELNTSLYNYLVSE